MEEGHIGWRGPARRVTGPGVEETPAGQAGCWICSTEGKPARVPEVQSG